MKTAISIPDDLFRDAEVLARRQKKARSSLYAEALRLYIDQHRGEGITEQLNRVYAEVPAGLDDELLRLQRETLLKSEW